MSWPSHDAFVRQQMNDYFARNMTRQYFEDIQNRNRERARESQTRKTYGSTSYSKESKRDRILAQDTPVSLALEKKFAEMDRQFYRSLNASSSFSLVKLLKSCLPW